MNYKPVVAGNQSNGNACTKACNVWQSTNNVNTASDGNSTNNVNAVSSTVNAAGIKVNVVGAKTSIELPNDPDMPELEDIVTQMNIRCCAEADMNNLNTFIPVSSTKKSLCTEFEKMIHEKFQMSSIDELTFFLGLQVKQKEDEIFISQDKSMIGSLMYLTSSRPDIMFVVCDCTRYQVNPKVSHLHAVKRDFLRLISWQCKKHTVVVNSTTEAEYVAALSCCGQVLWIQNQLLDYGDSNEKKLIQMIKIHTEKNIADLLTKAFDNEIGVNAGDSKFMLLGINLLLLGKVNAARHKLTAAWES
ncbi:hypothetical protein Tco_0646116 [Tanacetum coccineum]